MHFLLSLDYCHSQNYCSEPFEYYFNCKPNINRGFVKNLKNLTQVPTMNGMEIYFDFPLNFLLTSLQTFCWGSCEPEVGVFVN